LFLWTQVNLDPADENSNKSVTAGYRLRFSEATFRPQYVNTYYWERSAWSALGIPINPLNGIEMAKHTTEYCILADSRCNQGGLRLGSMALPSWMMDRPHIF